MTHRCAHTRVTAYRVNRCNMSPAPIIMDHHHQTCCLCRWIRHSLIHYWSCGDRTNRRRNICEGTVISVQINRQGEPSCVSMYENDENCRWKISPCIQGSHSDPPPSSSQVDGWYIYGIYKFLWKTLTQTRIPNPNNPKSNPWEDKSRQMTPMKEKSRIQNFGFSVWNLHAEIPNFLKSFKFKSSTTYRTCSMFIHDICEEVDLGATNPSLFL